jgi:hypothetical protein
MTEESGLRRAVLAFLFLGLALRVWQWLAEGTLWLDEIVLTRNILARSLGELVTRPLAFDQVAPLGFLAAVKLSTLAFGGGERALWLFSLISGIAGLLLFRRLAERTLRGIAVPLAMAMFALGLALIRYSAEVKQYGVDATVTIGLTLLAFDLRQRDRTNAGLLAAGLAGLVVIWFSQASAIVMAGLGAALAVMWLIERDRRTLRALLLTVPVWAAGSVLAVIVGERSMTPATRAFMQDFWRGGFLPLPPRPSTAVPWLWQQFTSLFGDPWTLRYPLPWLFALLALIGIAVLWRQRRDAALLVAAPIALTMLAAAAHQYPFRQRLIVFLVPSALLAAAAGAAWIAEQSRHKAAAVAIAAATLIPPVLALVEVGIPARVDHYRPIYAHLQANRRTGDAVYVTFLANSSAIFYGPRFGLGRADYQVGTCNRTDTRAYLRDLDRFRGRQRVWILSRTGPAYRIPREAMARYLGTIGVKRDALFVKSGVVDPLELELFDLSNPYRLRAASSDTFPVKPMPDYPRPGCRDWSGEAALTSSL